VESPRYSISVDTGGTFTDLVLVEGEDIVGLFKAATTAHDLFSGIEAALTLAAADVDRDVGALLAATDSFIYSTTHSTNAIIEGKTARTAFVTTRGNRDILLYREGGKDQPHNLAMPYPPPYIPRRLCFEVTERVLSDGTVAVPLVDREVMELIERLRACDVEAVAVCLLWSMVNPSHEQRVCELIRAELPSVAISVSHEVNPIVREYRRGSATAIDASIKNLMYGHLNDIEEKLRARGFRGTPLMVTHVSGGVMSLSEMCKRPIQTVDSGPSLAPIAGIVFAGTAGEADDGDILVIDTGGTSFDVSLAHRGRAVYTREKWLGERWYGHMTGLPAVDTRSLGAGGGSIAYVDEGGLLRVGPESAGANPGPVCYGRGGKRPTVTDAALALGYIDPDNFLGGLMQLDAAAARDALEAELGTPLGLPVEDAAEAVMTVAAEMMRGFITDMTVEQGRDPRECTIVAGGGAAGLNVVRIARDLDVGTVVIPRLAAGLSAVGGQFADVSVTYSRSYYTTSRDFDFDGVGSALAGLAEDVDAFLAAAPYSGEKTKRFFCEARYDQQLWEIDVELPDGFRFETASDVQECQRLFDDAYAGLFAVSQPQAPIEFVTWRAEGRIRREKPRLERSSGPVDQTAAAEPARVRIAHFDGQPLETKVFDGSLLEAGARVTGPAIIDEPTTTLVIVPGASVTVGGSQYTVICHDAGGTGAGSMSAARASGGNR
jgi:N-methylhydantoinase A